ncbi:MAG: SUMF1/EgtB/PvdO family nonheme iron enzyme [Bacteroidetes bacterium]|nr:SUMF1/EgtB/PvdO family nonheme iron enzyme [Bacteroidota bacterium]
MALIPAGTFRMGNITNHPDGSDSEKPVHEVTITRPFLIARTEVTQAQYEAVMGSNPSYFKGADLLLVRAVCFAAVPGAAMLGTAAPRVGSATIPVTGLRLRFSCREDLLVTLCRLLSFPLLFLRIFSMSK